MRCKSFDIRLGKAPLYSYDEEKDKNIFAATPTLPMSAYSEDKEDLRRRTELVEALDKEFKDWEHSYMVYPNGKRDNALHFGALNGIVRYDNRMTGESFVFKYDPYNPSLVLSGMLQKENVEKLNGVFKEFGRGLEKTDLMKEVNLDFDTKYKHLNPLFNELEKDGVIVADRKADKNFSDRLIITIPNEANFALSFKLNLEYSGKVTPKTLYEITKDVSELAGLIKPQHDTEQYLNRGSFQELNYGETDRLVQNVARDLDTFKVKVMRATKKVLGNNLEKPTDKERAKDVSRKQTNASLYKDGVALYNDTGR